MKHIKSLAAAAIMFSTGVNANNIPESPSIDSFNTVAPSFVQEKKDFNDNEMISLKTNKSLTINDVIEEKKSGVYISPTDKNEVVVLAFKTRSNEENLKTDEEIKKTLKEKNYIESHTQENDYLMQTIMKNGGKRGSFHMPGESKDEKYSYISMDVEQIDKMVKMAKNSKNNYSDEMIEMIPQAVLYHELAHAHKHQKEVMKEVNRGIKRLSEDEKSSPSVRKDVESIGLGGENYADSFMLLNMAVNMKDEHGDKKALQLHDELYTFFTEDFRKDGNENSYNIHATKAVLKTSKDFIDNNWEMIEGFKKDKNDKSLEQISASITNGTLNHPSIAPANFSKQSQNEVERNGGLKSSALRDASKDVNKELQKMVSVDGDNLNFNYAPNVHKEYKETLKFNRQ